MTRHQKIGLYIAILGILIFVGFRLLLFSDLFTNSHSNDTANSENINSSYHDFDDIDEDENLLEVTTPMSCTYNGRLTLNTETADNLKRFQSVLNDKKQGRYIPSF